MSASVDLGIKQKVKREEREEEKDATRDRLIHSLRYAENAKNSNRLVLPSVNFGSGTCRSARCNKINSGRSAGFQKRNVKKYLVGDAL